MIITHKLDQIICDTPVQFILFKKKNRKKENLKLCTDAVHC